MKIKALAVALALAGCAQETPAAKAPVAAGCAAQSDSVWTAGGASYAVQATSSGPSCAQAVALLVVRAPDGTAMLVHAAPTEYLFGLKDAADAPAMERALAEWSAQPAGSLSSTAGLPAWAEGAAQPDGEFPFYPDDGVDRAAYEAARAQDAPLFCFAQGGESLSCHVLRDGRLESLGVQTFPG